jgi:HD-like signal output (HDOD) protein
MTTALLTRQSSTEYTPPPSIRQAVLSDLERIDTYPTLSDTTIRAMAMMNNPDTSTAEVAGLIYRDTVLAASVLQLANNWMYRGRKEVVDVQQAVLRIGLKECGRMLSAIGLRSMSNSLPVR